MAKPPKIYWDTCAWLGFLNGEADKKRELQIVYGNARNGRCQLWTSTLSLVETRRLADEKDLPKPLSEENSRIIDAVFKQPFVYTIPLAVDIADRARAIFREVPTKWQDAVHLASALRWNSDIMHTYDHDDLLKLSLRYECRNGQKLLITYPDETTDGPLFSAAR